MSLITAPRATVVAQSMRRKTRPSMRTGSAEDCKSKIEKSHCLEAWEASKHMFASMAAWGSGNDQPIADLMKDVVHALERLECYSAGQNNGTDRDAFSVRHALSGRSFSGSGYV